MSVYEDCILTLKDSTVIRDFDIQLNPTIVLSGNKVYSPCYGIVVQVSKYNYDEKYRVIIQYNGYISIAFTDLTEVEVKVNDLVKLNTYIGTCNNSFGFELLLADIYDTPPSNFRVVVTPNLSLFKADPRPILDGRFVFKSPSSEDITDGI